ncbi:MAG: hypothetical protein R3F05_16110 [Planctomycetota bacterium]
MVGRVDAHGLQVGRPEASGGDDGLPVLGQELRAHGLQRLPLGGQLCERLEPCLDLTCGGLLALRVFDWGQMAQPIELLVQDAEFLVDDRTLFAVFLLRCGQFQLARCGCVPSAC